MTNQNNDKSKNGKRIALILVALLLIAAIAFGAYTYSKYVSSGKGDDSATVAAWGYTVTVGNGADTGFGFSQYYGADGEADTDSTNAVIAGIASDKNVVAPGAHGSTTITISGYAEVDAVLKVVAESTNNIYIEMTADGQTPATLYYFPVLFSLSDGDSGSVNITNQPLANIVAELGKLSEELPSSTSTTGTTTTYTLSWAWAFEGTPESSDQPQNVLWTKSDDTYIAHTAKITAADVDSLDTSLGQAAVESSTLSNTSVSVGGQTYSYDKNNCHTSLDLKITVSITQATITPSGD